jgi:hypothetical protein
MNTQRLSEKPKKDEKKQESTNVRERPLSVPVTGNAMCCCRGDTVLVTEKSKNQQSFANVSCLCQ